MSSNRSKVIIQQQIETSNPVEQHYLETCGIYQNKDYMAIQELRMASGMNDLQALEIKELVWPTKEVIVEKQITCFMPGEKELQTTTVLRKERVPMSIEEKLEHDIASAKEALAEIKKQERPRAATKERQYSKPKTQTKSKSKK